MKFKVTNVCERGVVENLPGVTRISLQPGDTAIIEDVGETTAVQIVHFIKAMRGPNASGDLQFEEIVEFNPDNGPTFNMGTLEDKKVVEKIKEAEEEKKEFVPVKEEQEDFLSSLAVKTANAEDDAKDEAADFHRAEVAESKRLNKVSHKRSK